MMNEQSLDILSASIAKEHGVVLNADDPVLMLHTINAHLLEENKKAQKALLVSFQQEMELIISRWHAESKETAERILNTSLQAAKTAIMDNMDHFTEQHTVQIQKVTEEIMEKILQKSQHTEHLMKWNIAAAVITFLSVCTLVAGVYFLFI